MKTLIDIIVILVSGSLIGLAIILSGFLGRVATEQIFRGLK